MKTYGIQKTTVRLTVILPDNYGNVQRLYDYGKWFDLQRSRITDVEQLADFITDMKARGARLIDTNEYFDDDDLKIKHSFTYELILRDPSGSHFLRCRPPKISP